MSASENTAETGGRETLRGGRVFLEGHGCSASFADTEILGGIISSNGYELVDAEEDADISVLVTCSVKSVTEQRMLSRIRELSDGGKRRLIVAGCLPKADPRKIRKIDPNMSMIGPGNLDKIVPALQSSLDGGQATFLENTKLVKLGLPRTRKNQVIGIIEIASGCLSSCSFCQVKLVKGVIFSYPEQDLVEEARSLIQQGSREIWLTSTDNACYGRDSKSSLPNLLRKVTQIEGGFKVRVGMMNPIVTVRILEDLIEVYLSEKVFKFLHLPVQSGNDRVLLEMQRGYNVRKFCEMVKRFREKHPFLTLSTDVIVGFPNETESDFEDSMELLRKIKPDIVNLSRFGARPGTKAELMHGQVSSQISKDRSERMTVLIKEISRDLNNAWVGWKGEILLDEIGREAIVGRNFAYKPCVIKSIDLGTSGRDVKELLGKSARVEIVSATSSTLSAVLLDHDPKGQSVMKSN